MRIDRPETFTRLDWQRFSRLFAFGDCRRPQTPRQRPCLDSFIRCAGFLATAPFRRTERQVMRQKPPNAAHTVRSRSPVLRASNIRRAKAASISASNQEMDTKMDTILDIKRVTMDYAK
jgi:hypothetical protein